MFGDRSLFPALEARAYLAHAAVSPISTRARAAMARTMDLYASRGQAAFGETVGLRHALRPKLAKLISAASDEIAYVPSTTQGVIDVALTLPWKRGDRVILFRGEFPANVTPFQRAAELFGLEVTMLPLAPFERDHEEGMAMLERELDRGARLVAVSAVQFQTGLRMPLEEIGAACEARRVELFVDAIQAVGSVPIDVDAMRIDYLSCGGHKWLMGVEGAGFVYARRACAERLRDHVAGWTSHERALDFLFQGRGHLRYDRPFKRGIERVEGGAQSAIGYAALDASVDLLLELDPKRVHAHVNAYLDRLEPELTARGFKSARAADPRGRSCILSVQPPEGRLLLPIHERLMALGVSCSIPDGWLRFAPHFANSQSEIPDVIRAVESALS